MGRSEPTFPGSRERLDRSSREQPPDPAVLLVPHGFEANYTVGLVRGLLANGVALQVVTSDADHARIAALGVPCTNLRGDVSSDRAWPAKLANLLRYYFRLAWLIARCRPTVVHFTGIFRDQLLWFEAPFLSLLFRFFADRYVYTVHNLLPHGRTDSAPFRLVYRAVVYRLPDVLIAHTRETMACLQEHFDVPASKLLLGTIGLNQEVPIRGIDRAEARRRLRLQTQDRVVLFFGRIDHYKGLDLLLAALGRGTVGSDLTLVVAGAPARQELRADIERQIAHLARSRRVLVRLDDIPNEDIEIYFQSCDLLVMPYRAVTQSGVLFLALAFGVPVVATDVGSLREFIGPETGILVPATDIDALAEGIARFFARQADFSRERIAARAQRFAWPNASAPIAALYHDAVQRRDVRGG